MDYFDYKSNRLYCEDVPIETITNHVGTPCYIYSHATLNRHFNAFNDAFSDIQKIVCYSAKANSNGAILRLFQKRGGGLDIVSGGELFRGLKAGFSPQKIVYSGVGKRVDEIDYALNQGILMFNVESIEELQQLNERGKLLKKKAPISFRVNPDVDPQTHPYISTGLKKNKFGINVEHAIKAYALAKELPFVEILGIDCHIGSQITKIQPFKDALSNIMALIGKISQLGIQIKYLDLGGGLGITYQDEVAPHPEAYAQAIKDVVQQTPLTLIFEPGRVIVGNAGILVTEVLYRKKGVTKTFVIIDAGMNDLLRPTLYDAYHDIIPVVDKNKEEIVADLVGPICETGDFLALDRQMPDYKQGELVAVRSAGAYGFAMSSNYCSRLRVPEVMVMGNQYQTIREREQYADLVRGEAIPDFV